MLANYSLVLSLHQSFDHEQVEELDLLIVRLVARTSSQLGLLSIGTTLGPVAG